MLRLVNILFSCYLHISLIRQDSDWPRVLLKFFFQAKWNDHGCICIVPNNISSNITIVDLIEFG